MPRLPLRAKAEVWKELGYEPTPGGAQIHTTTEQHIIVVGGIGGGKSYSVAKDALPETVLPPIMQGSAVMGRLYWLVGPEYDDCRPEFQYLWNDLEALNMIRSVRMPDEGKCKLTTKTGTEIETRSGDNPAKCMKGRGPQGIIYCEAGRITKGLYEQGLGRLARSEEGPEGWSLAAGVVKDSLPWFLEMAEIGEAPNNDYDLATVHIPSWDNPFQFPGGYENPKIQKLKRVLPEHDFNEMVAAVMAPPSDIVFPEFSRERNVRPIAFQEWRNLESPEQYRIRKPVFLAIDPGYWPGAYAVLAIQEAGPYIFVIDEVYLHRHTVDQVIEECRARPWWPNVKLGVIDPFGGIQHQGMQSHKEAWMRYGKIRVFSGFRTSILEGIARYRFFMSRGSQKLPYIFYDPRCKNAIVEHRRYSRTPTKEGRALRENPIDRDNHAIKAITYYVISTRGRSGSKRRTGKVPFRMDDGRAA